MQSRTVMGNCQFMLRIVFQILCKIAARVSKALGCSGNEVVSLHIAVCPNRSLYLYI